MSTSADPRPSAPDAVTETCPPPPAAPKIITEAQAERIIALLETMTRQLAQLAAPSGR